MTFDEMGKWRNAMNNSSVTNRFDLLAKLTGYKS